MWGSLKWIVIIALAAIGITFVLKGCAGGLLWGTDSDNFVDGPGMERDPFDLGVSNVSWSYGGDENGSQLLYTLSREDDDYATFEAYEREAWYLPGETRTYRVSASVLDEIAKLGKEYGLYAAQSRGGDMFVLDGSMWHLRIECTNGPIISLDESQEFSDDEYEGIFAIREIFIELDSGDDATVNRDSRDITLEGDNDFFLLFTLDDSDLADYFYMLCPFEVELKKGDVEGEWYFVVQEDLLEFEGNAAGGTPGSLVFDPEANACFFLSKDSDVTDSMLLIATPNDQDGPAAYFEILVEASPGDYEFERVYY